MYGGCVDQNNESLSDVYISADFFVLNYNLSGFPDELINETLLPVIKGNMLTAVQRFVMRKI